MRLREQLEVISSEVLVIDGSRHLNPEYDNVEDLLDREVSSIEAYRKPCVDPSADVCVICIYLRKENV